MNLNGPEPMKQTIEELQKGIKEIAFHRSDKPTDLFQFYHPEIRKHFVDAYNLCRIWTQGLLYWKGLYPQQAFQLKTAFSRKVYVVKSKILRQYLDKFFQSVCQNFEYVDFLEVEIYELDQIGNQIHVQSQRFYFSYSQKFVNCDNIQEIKKKSINTIQRQMEFKRFLGKMEEEFNKGYYRPLDKTCTYQLLMGYKWDHKSKQNKHRLNLLNRWTQIDDKTQVKVEMINHAGTGELEVMCQRLTPDNGLIMEVE